MKYYFIAGEASGDLHASNLIAEIVRQDKGAELRGFGGERMEKAGMQLTRHYREMAFMGFLPVLMNLKKIKQNFKTCEEDLLDFQPDVLVLVDYPGFNLRMAEFAKKHGIRVFYYISPKIWIWKKHRIKKIKAFVDEMFTILPFETEFYKELDYEVNYVGNPVLDEVMSKPPKVDFQSFVKENHLPDQPIIALLPGSRLQEIKSLLPPMLEAAAAFSNYQAVVTAAPNIDQSVYERLLADYPAARLLHNKSYEVMQQAEVAVLASGTVSLEAGILRCPQIVCYRMDGGALFYWLGKHFVKIVWVSLVNLILRRTAVKELLQHNCTVKNIRQELSLILNDATYKKQIRESYDELRQQLGEPGASARAASAMIEKLGGKN
ncbi:lipid-A-disaccharide synthase [Sunxiuqinia dokdonensis]|uniref:Lipid-A-disaccharide synthase n=1 Tax=Sunxiuqinia dokdonensis TaxID=1409788 RepID=A0A0L8VB24_9BACT|nr:lipid-A-disaccharide synthase [Sunxiuqinia dokdonensis]KOH45402.1 lipid-A-disaccharide synthase [Sunxiuqinia dokdonensis]